jgi:Flp pilus assembly protein TadD
MKKILLASAVVVGFFSLAACGSDEGMDFTVEKPDSLGRTSATLKTRESAPAKPSYASSATKPDNLPDFSDEDEANATVLHTADRMKREGDYGSASILYMRAAAANPESTLALKGLAECEEAKGQPREAISAYRQIVKIKEESFYAHRGIARNLMRMELYDEAVKQLERLQALEGKTVDTLNLFGMAYTRKKDFPKAIEAFQQALEIEPENMNTRNNLGFAYIMSGKFDEAIALFEGLVHDKNATAQHRQNLALAYGLAGREKEARSVAMQDLSPAAVEQNLKTYRLMREKIRGGKIVADKPKPAAKKKPVKKVVKAKDAPVPEAAPVPASEVAPAPAAAPAPEVQKEPETPAPAAPAPALETSPAPPPAAPAPAPASP